MADGFTSFTFNCNLFHRVSHHLPVSLTRSVQDYRQNCPPTVQMGVLMSAPLASYVGPQVAQVLGYASSYAVPQAV